MGWVVLGLLHSATESLSPNALTGPPGLRDPVRGNSVQGVPMPRVIPSGPRLPARYRLAGPGRAQALYSLVAAPTLKCRSRAVDLPREPHLALVKATQGIRMAAGP
ncbi:hypothetical protein NDU88_005409 [Pleurodeles waltl]|uniref:Uncharacterized protein n=1 Tax=Pleurodeles waltl TaxID=8319 RepID=A0AAV7QEP1_PLEWA|nr:hypothetical protein NDU88_005409 [Pleurodeles waltl]